MSRRKRLTPAFFTILILVFLASAIAASTDLFGVRRAGLQPASSASSDSLEFADAKLRVYFFDVGQADAILITLPNGAAVAVDAGERETQEALLQKILDAGVSKLDALVMTHPHDDHIGGMDFLIQNLPVAKIYMTEAVSTTRTFETLLETIAEKKIRVVKAAAGGSIDLDPEVGIDILSPDSVSDGDMNENSVILRVRYGKTVFLLTGDAGSAAEKDLLQSSADWKADVLKVGHHGSNSSSTNDFLAAVRPAYAVISVGKDNDYGHPSATVLKRLEQAGASVLRTDRDGTVVMGSDGKTVMLLPG